MNNDIKSIKIHLKEKYSDGIIVKGKVIGVTNRSINELLSSSYTRWLKNNDYDIYFIKIKLLDLLHFLYEIEYYVSIEEPMHIRKDDIIKLKRSLTYIIIEDNKYYAEIITAIRINGCELIYDIVNIIKEDSSIGVTPRSDESSLTSNLS